jgi:RND superfamily putative drug exporter
MFVAIVVVLSFLLLMIVFRSLVIPATAAVMNLLSAGAAFGVIVAVFQWGWLSSLVGVRAADQSRLLPRFSCSRCCSGSRPTTRSS